MNEIDRTNLNDPTKYRLNETTKIENYFNSEMNQRKSGSKKLVKCVSGFNYIEKVLIFFKCSKWWSLYYFVCKCYWSTSWNSKCKSYFNFSCNNRNNQKIAKHNKK